MAGLTRRCPACFAPLARGAQDCPACGHDGSEAVTGEQPLTPGTRLLRRYRVGVRADTGFYWGFDEKEHVRVQLEAYTGPLHAAFFFRADAMSRVADCAAIVPVLDAFSTEGAAVCVHGAAAGFPLCRRAFPLSEAELALALSAAADALLVLHSLKIAHGALDGDRLRVTEEGALRLLVPAAPCEASPAEDLVRLGALLTPLHGKISKRLDDVLVRLSAGRYASVFELRHALSGFAAAERL